MQTLKLLTKWDSFTSTSSFCIGELRIRCMSAVCVPSSTHAWWWNLGVVLRILVGGSWSCWFWPQDLHTWPKTRHDPPRIRNQQDWSKVIILFDFIPILLTNGQISFWFWRSGLSLAKIMWKLKGLWFLERWVVIRILLFSYESASLASLHSCGITRVTSFGGMLECQRKTSQHHS